MGKISRNSKEPLLNRWIKNGRRFSCFDDVINIMLAFLTNNVPSSKFFAFLTQIIRNAIFVICSIKIIICETESINMWIWVNEACRFTDFSNITSLWRRNDIILILKI